jgi:hypothetical protein
MEGARRRSRRIVVTCLIYGSATGCFRALKGFDISLPSTAKGADHAKQGFKVANLDIQMGGGWRSDAFALQSEFTLTSKEYDSFNPLSEPVKLQAGPFIGTIPAGSFARQKDGSYTFNGAVEGAANGMLVDVEIKPAGTLRYALNVKASNLDLAGSTDKGEQVSFGIGDCAGSDQSQSQSDPGRQGSELSGRTVKNLLQYASPKRPIFRASGRAQRCKTYGAL